MFIGSDTMNKKRVLVTGADGFIGSHLVEILHAEGFQVRALTQYNSFNSWGWLEKLRCINDIEVVSGDIRDSHFCLTLCQNIDIVFHLAALIAIPYSYNAPQSYVDVNVNGTLNLCQAAIKNKVSRFMHTSTSEVYGTAQYVPIDESHPLQPQSPYSASKISADAMAMSYYYSFDLPVTVMRPFNTYGPRQSARAVIPTIISQIAANNSELKLGDTATTRDFNYVTDTCTGMLMLANCQKAIGKSVNIGSNNEISILDTALTIKSLMNSEIKIVTDPQRLRPINSEVQRLVCDNRLFTELTGGMNTVTIQEGLQRTIDWITEKENLSGYKVNIYNV